jgi:hypothetical protein
MKPRLLTVLTLASSWIILLSSHATVADPPREADLLKRIEQLEKRVADLEKAIKERPSVKEPATATEKKLIGTWTITADSKKTAMAKKLNWANRTTEPGPGSARSGRLITDLNLKADGTCALVIGGQVYNGGSYNVTVVGSVTRINIEWAPNILGTGNPQGAHPIQGYVWNVRIASVSEEELVFQLASGEEWVKLQYTRAK